jgi:hypothetical protein
VVRGRRRADGRTGSSFVASAELRAGMSSPTSTPRSPSASFSRAMGGVSTQRPLSGRPSRRGDPNPQAAGGPRGFHRLRTGRPCRPLSVGAIACGKREPKRWGCRVNFQRRTCGRARGPCLPGRLSDRPQLAHHRRAAVCLSSRRGIVVMDDGSELRCPAAAAGPRGVALPARPSATGRWRGTRAAATWLSAARSARAPRIQLGALASVRDHRTAPPVSRECWRHGARHGA